VIPSFERLDEKKKKIRVLMFVNVLFNKPRAVQMHS
jgi:hypothetical protein